MTSITLLPLPVPTFSAVDAPPAAEVVERLDVGIGQIVDVDVVADARAVGRGIVVAEHLHRRALAQRCLHHQRDEVERLPPVLADAAVGAGAGGVEVAQADRAQAVADAVPVAGSARSSPSTRRRCSRVGSVRLRSTGTTAGVPYTEHDDENTMSLTPAVSIASTSFTVPVTLLNQYRDGLLHRLADALVRGEVDDLGDVASVHSSTTRSRSAMLPSTSSASITALRWPYSIESSTTTSWPKRGQPANGVRADVAGAAGDEDAHRDALRSCRNQSIIRVSPSRSSIVGCQP